MTESLAVRHRPRRFGAVAGQRHVVAVLRAAAAKRTPPQQLLLAGPSGTGKTTLARIFAAALFCEHPADDGDACGQCQTCLDVTGPGGRHPDVIELDAASHGGIDQIRDIGSAAHIAPMRAPWKLYIIDEAHGLTAAGGQAALRLIEEPPPHTLFALATTDPDKLPTALRGRCQHLEVLPPTREEMHANLARICAEEGWGVTDGTLDAVLDAADPALGVRGTVMLLEKLANHVERGGTLDPAVAHELIGVADPAVFAAMTDAITAGDRPGALRLLEKALTGAAAPVVKAQLTGWARSALRAAVTAGEPEAPALHWLSTVAACGSFDGALHLCVAKMASPHLAGDVTALEALVTRAEAAAAQLAHPSPATSTPPLGSAPIPGSAPAVPARHGDPAGTVSPAVTAGDALAQPSAPPSAPGPVRGTRVTLPDAALTSLMNAVSPGAPRAALMLRRAVIHRDGSHWSVQLAPEDHDGAAALGFADRLQTAAAGLGGTATLLP